MMCCRIASSDDKTSSLMENPVWRLWGPRTPE
jgi:hypothetical protein